MIKNNEVLEVARFIKFHHPKFKEVALWKILSYLDKFKGTVQVEREEGEIAGVALYITIGDERFDRVKRQEEKLRQDDSINDLIEDTDNICFIALVAENLTTIRRGLRKVIKEKSPNRIMWFDDYKNRDRVIVLEKGGK